MASRSTYVRYWFVTVDDDVTDVNAQEVSRWIEAVLLDPKGWRKSGYEFIQINIEDGLWAREQPEGRKYVIHARVSTEDTIFSECGFGNLSCADMAENVIFFNRNRWLHGSKQSNLDVESYRVYVILHEFGHLLGRKHHTCSKRVDDPCPVMYQQTISKGCCRPNPWPLTWE
jgi:hypothetical protein